MRELDRTEVIQRGCKFCTDVERVKWADNGRTQLRCKHEECPFYELDWIDTYDEYLKKTPKSDFIHTKTLMHL